jgi:hypothetical protein
MTGIGHIGDLPDIGVLEGIKNLFPPIHPIAV